LKSINLAIEKIAWPALNVTAMQTTRYPTKTTSKKTIKHSLLPCYDHFNLGLHVNDTKQNVVNNREQLLNVLSTKTKIQWLDQVHGSNVAIITGDSLQSVQADACITREKKLALAIMTADCLPILLSNKAGTEIAAVHAGWRPLADNIIVKTLAQMHSQTQNIVAWLGPCIGTTHFEVGSEVKQAFIDISVELSVFFIANDRGRYQADLSGIATFFLQQAGISSIAHINECTFTQKNKYYSYRREQKTGRMASIICISG